MTSSSSDPSSWLLLLWLSSSLISSLIWAGLVQVLPAVSPPGNSEPPFCWLSGEEKPGLFQENEEFGGLGILIGWKVGLPGEGSEEEEEEGDTEGGGVSCWKGERRRGDADDMLVDGWGWSLLVWKETINLGKPQIFTFSTNLTLLWPAAPTLLNQTLDLQLLRGLQQSAQHVLVDEDLASVHVLHQGHHVLVLDVRQQDHVLGAGSCLKCNILSRGFYCLLYFSSIHSEAGAGNEVRFS